MSNFPEAPPETGENRYIICQMSVETPIQELVKEAVAKGWSDCEVLSAMIEVCENLVLAARSNDELDSILAALRKNPAGDL